MKRLTRKLLANDIVMLDPYDCGSTVGYTITRSRHGLSGEIELTDCTRKIVWYFADNDHCSDKIDRAIKMLTDFRAAFIKARRGKK